MTTMQGLLIPQGAEIRWSLPAGAGLTDAVGRFVKISAGTFVLCAAATDVPVGVLQANVAAGLQAEVVSFGPSMVVADGVIAQGALIGTSADGQADTKIPGTDTTEYGVGRALEAAAQAGDQIVALINCVNPLRAA